MTEKLKAELFFSHGTSNAQDKMLVGGGFWNSILVPFS